LEPYCFVNLVTDTARWVDDDDVVDDDDDNDVVQIGPKVTFKDLLLKVLYFAVRLK